MAWRWYKRLRLFGGLNTNLTNNGVGWSWGIGFLRFGISPNGRRWISIGIPGTGIRYFKYLKSTTSQPYSNQTDESISPESLHDRQQVKPITKWRNLK